MKKYKVKVIAHQLKNQVIAVFGDEVNEDQLNGNADELVKKGFIELVEDSDTKVSKTEDSEKDKTPVLDLGPEKEVKTDTKVSKK